jgi:hypothetical protein
MKSDSSNPGDDACWQEATRQSFPLLLSI